MKSGKLTVKHQVTIPRDVRKALGLKAGDHVVFDLEAGRAVLRRVDTDDFAWRRLSESSLSEWNSAENDEDWAYL